MRYFLHLAYLGTAYRGWQRQPNVISVQEVIEAAILKILKKPVTCVGCSRTDAQVHASQYFAQIDWAEPLDIDLAFVLNKVLPHDISVFEVLPMDDWLHVQFKARKRTYDYFIHTIKNPFLHNLSAYYPIKVLDLESIQAACALLPQYQDYRGFCKTPDKHDSTLCKVYTAQFLPSPNGEQYRFTITSNRFVRGMIRLIVGNLLEIGTGKMSLAAFEAILKNKQAPKYINFAHPQGLYLSKIKYDFLDLPVRQEFPNILQPIDK